ncbi:MAG: hypothetical protein ACRCY8_20130 [Dermatophilaceae bacterium]
MSALLASTMLAGCGDAPERAVTVGSASPAGGTTNQPDRPAGSGDQLDAAKIKQALLAVGDLPTGWASKANDDSGEDESVIEPASCQKLFDTFGDKSSEAAAAEAAVTFTSGGDLGTELSQEIASYGTERQSKKVEEIAAALTKCSKMTLVDGADRIPVTISGLSFPNLGEQTLAMRMTFETSGITVTADLAVVAVGHNVVSFTTVGLQPIAGAELEKIARAGMSKMAAVAEG